MRRTPFIRAVLAAAVLAAAAAHAQLDAEASFREGNHLFRSGLHGAALLRYREAAAQGMSSPLLDYNLGVVLLELADYDAAAERLSAAAALPELAPLAYYALGVALDASGHGEEARAAFQRSARLADSRRLRALAERAAVPADERPAAMRAAPGREEDPRAPIAAPGRAGELRLLASARFGQDDNVYGAPAAAYVDLADAAQPTVTPVVHAASFMPVDVVAEYVLHNEALDTEFVFGYRLSGDFYDAEYSNANRVSQRFDIGADIVLAETGNRRRTVQSAFFVRGHQETNYDPDNGLDRALADFDVSERFEYRAAGVEGEFGHELGRWYWGFDARLEKRLYDEVPLLRSFDHEFTFARATVEYALGDATTLSLGLRRYRRIYDERLARDADGELLAVNDTLRYDYRGVTFGVARRLGRALEVGLEVGALERLDEFVGYFDYERQAARLSAVYRPSPRFYLAAAAEARNYEYPHAFAFNVPTERLRETDDTSLVLEVEYRVTERLSLWLELDSEDVTSTDPRAAFTRTRSMLGLKWQR